MWTCPLCGQHFVNTGQIHSCGDRVLADFLNGKSDHTVSLFWHFAECYRQLGNIQLGKNFIDVVLPFDKPYTDNLCFRKIAQVPGSKQYNHHLRMLNKEDVNKEVKKFMKLAFDNGK